MEYSFLYQLLFNDTFVIFTKMCKQKFMKKKMRRKKVTPLCTASDFRGKGGCWEALLLKNSIVQVWNTLVWLACASARKTQRYAKIGSKIFWGRCAVGYREKKTMKVIKKIYKAFGLIVIKYVQYMVGSSKDMIYSSGLTIFPQRARRHPAEFGFQSLDSDLQRICGNVL